MRSYSYEPYGRERQNTGTGPQAAFRFAGGYLMPGAIYHFGQRYMSPVTGRWTQQDPLDRPSDLREGNRYLYAGDDPINLVDPSGEVSCSTFGIGHVCKAVSSALSHRTVRCLLFGLGAAGIGVEGALAARELRASVRAGSTLFDALTKLVRGAGPNIGTTGSISVIVSEVAGGCP